MSCAGNASLGVTRIVLATGSFLPCFVADARPSLMRLGPLTPALGNDLWFLIHPDMRRSARVRAFVDFVTAELIRQRPLIDAAVSVSA